MLPYYMREEATPGKAKLEIAAAVVAIGLLVVCAMVRAPRLNLTTPAAQAARAQEQTLQSLAEFRATLGQLQTRNEAAAAQLADVTSQLKSTRSDLAKYNTLGTQVASTTSKVQELETSVRQTADRLAKFSESAVLQKVTKERDEAVTEAKARGDQVRQMTLALQKAGIYP